jgi:hypothetical protein
MHSIAQQACSENRSAIEYDRIEFDMSTVTLMGSAFYHEHRSQCIGIVLASSSGTNAAVEQFSVNCWPKSLVAKHGHTLVTEPRNSHNNTRKLQYNVRGATPVRGLEFTGYKDIQCAVD